MDRVVARAEVLGEQLLLPVDRARAALNRFVLTSALGRGLIRKETRIGAQAVAGIGVAFLLTALAPLLLFAVAPVVLGVPHLAADLRYLVLQPRYRPLVRVLLVAGCVPFVLLRGLPCIGVPIARAAPMEMAFATLCLGAAAIASALGAGRARRLLFVLPAVLALGLVASRHADGARIVFAHAHNVVAIVVWGLLFRARRGARRALVLPVACTAVATLALVGLGLARGPALAATSAFGVQLGTIGGWLAPGLPQRAAVALVLSYVFLQSVHYSIWLGLIPAETVRGEAARSFRMSLRALLRDFGALGLLAVAIVSAATIALGTRDLTRTRDAYLTLSAFHGYLELAVLVIALSGRRDLWSRACRSSAPGS